MQTPRPIRCLQTYFTTHLTCSASPNLSTSSSAADRPWGDRECEELVDMVKKLKKKSTLAQYKPVLDNFKVRDASSQRMSKGLVLVVLVDSLPP
jgi:hypothetical protein